MDILMLWFLFAALPAIDAWSFFLTSVTILLLFGFVVAFIVGEVDDEDKVRVITSKIKKPLILMFTLSVLSSLSPNEEQIKYIIGGYFALETASAVSEMEEAKRLPDNVLGAVNSFLEEIKDENVVTDK